MTRPGTRIAVWAAAAVAVTTVAALAISASVGASEAALSPQDVARELASDAATATPDSGSGTAGQSPGATAATEVFQLTAGTLVASCSDGMAVLRSWTPNPGYRAMRRVNNVDGVLPQGPAPAVSVRFESDTADDVTVTIYCDGGPEPGRPFARIATGADDHDGDDGGHGGGDNSGGGGSGRDHLGDN